MIARRRAFLLVIPIAAGAAVLASSPGETAAPKRLSISIAPELRPAYSASVPDYTVRCGKPVAFSASVPAGQSVAVDGGAAQSGAVHHSIPLRPGQGFRFTVNTVTHNVRCVPPDFPRWRVQGRGLPEVEWLVFAPDERKVKPGGAPYSVIADRYGVPVWWKQPDGAFPVNTRLLPDGTVTWARLGGPFSQTYWDHVKLDGGALAPFKAAGSSGADHHDFTLLPNGNHLMISYRPRRHVDLHPFGGPRDATVLDGYVQELTPDGRLVWQWTTKGHVRLAESAIGRAAVGFEGRTAYDLIHMNSVMFHGPYLVFSGKGVSAVYGVRRSTGKIAWKVGGTHRRESLRVRHDPYGQAVFGAQHDARMWPDGTLTAHDNAEFRHRGFPRIPRFRLDLRRRTATLVEDVRDKRLIQSYCCGSGTRLTRGRWLIAWGANPFITELDSAAHRHRPIFTIKLPRLLFSYRVQGVAPGVVTRDALRAGMDAMYPRR
ncbi:MAG: hypothetical protein QOE38_2380 [Thermoleophilaceae bacterium]|nr:hypothetical protein [Thermoleophilaceae bacterium]